MSTLKLTVHAKAFEVMVTGEKTWEFRKPSRWIMSRLWKEIRRISGIPVFEPREYDFIEIRNGYGKFRPVFTAKFCGFMENTDPFNACYSNGLCVQVERRDQIIKLGKIKNIQNYNL